MLRITRMPRPIRTVLVILMAWRALSADATDLLDSWRAARTYDATFAAAEAALRVAQEKIPQADAIFASHVDLVTSANEARKDYQSGNQLIQASTQKQGQQAAASIVWSKSIYDVTGAVKRDRLYREAEQARVQYIQAQQDLILGVAKAYFDVLLARDNVRLAGAQRQAVGEQLGLAKQSYELGLTSVTDADDAQARYDGIVAAEVAGKTDLANKSGVFRQLTALEPAQLGEVSPLLADRAGDAEHLAALVGQAKDANLSVQLLMLGVDIAHRTVDQYRLASSPVATLFANYGNQLDAGSIASSTGRDITRSASIGVQLSIPLWDGGSRSSLLRQAIAQEDQQAALLEATRRDAERLAMNYFNNIRDGVLRIASLDRARASGENSVNSNRIGREAGVRTTIDVLNAEQTYYQTLYSLSAARYDLMFNRLQLAATVGALNEAMLGEVNSSIVKP